MKKVIILSLIIASANAFSQVIIGDAVGTASTKTSVLLEFAAQAAGSNTGKGLILLYVRTLPTAAPTMVEGTIVLDASTRSAARIKYYNGNTTSGKNGWVDLSGQDANLTTLLLATQPTVAQAPELVGSKAIIGSGTSAADGVLVLESTTKAMVLPTVADVQGIPSPSPGMMVYINKAGVKRLAVYNGSKWSFWKP